MRKAAGVKRLAVFLLISLDFGLGTAEICHTKLILCLLELYGSANALAEFVEEVKFQSAILVKYNTGLCGSRHRSGMCYVKLQGSEIVKMISAEWEDRFSCTVSTHVR